MAFRTPPTNPFAFLNPTQVGSDLVQGVRDFRQREEEVADEESREFVRRRDEIANQLNLILAAPDLTPEDRAQLEPELTRLQGLNDLQELQSFLTQPRQTRVDPTTFRSPFGGGIPTRNFQSIMGEIAGRVTLQAEERERETTRLEESRRFVREELFPILTNPEVTAESRQTMLAAFLNQAPEGAITEEEVAAAWALAGFVDRNALDRRREELQGVRIANDRDAIALGIEQSTMDEQITLLEQQVQRGQITNEGLTLANDLARGLMPSQIQAAINTLFMQDRELTLADLNIAEANEEFHRNQTRWYLEEQAATLDNRIRETELEQVRQLIDQRREEFEREGIRFDAELEDRMIAEVLAAQKSGVIDGLDENQIAILAELEGVIPGTPGFDARMSQIRSRNAALIQAEADAVFMENRLTELGIDSQMLSQSILRDEQSWNRYVRQRQRSNDVLTDATENLTTLGQAASGGDVLLIKNWLRYVENPEIYPVKSRLLEDAGIDRNTLNSALSTAEEVQTRVRTDANLRNDLLRMQIDGARATTLQNKLSLVDLMAQNFENVQDVNDIDAATLAQLNSLFPGAEGEPTDFGLTFLRAAVTRRTALADREQAVGIMDELTATRPKNVEQWRAAYVQAAKDAGIDGETAQVLAQGWIQEFGRSDLGDDLSIMKTRADIALLEARAFDLLRGDPAEVASVVGDIVSAYGRLEDSISARRQVVEAIGFLAGCGTRENGLEYVESQTLSPQVRANCTRISNELASPLLTDLQNVQGSIGLFLNSLLSTGAAAPGVTEPDGSFDLPTGERFTVPFQGAEGDLNTLGPQTERAAANAAASLAQNNIEIDAGRRGIMDDRRAGDMARALVEYFRGQGSNDPVGEAQALVRLWQQRLGATPEDFGVEEVP